MLLIFNWTLTLEDVYGSQPITSVEFAQFGVLLGPPKGPPEYVGNMPWNNPLFARTTAAVGWRFAEFTPIGSLAFNATDAQELGQLRGMWQEALLSLLLLDKWLLRTELLGILIPFENSWVFPRVVDCFSFSWVTFGVAGTLVYVSFFHLEFDDPCFNFLWI